ncbi:MAG: chorismate synthase [Promethearchaeota archaeon]
MSPANSFGERYIISLVGESHGKGVGVVIDGIPAGYAVDVDDINSELSRRRPGQSAISTPRRENDEVDLLSGVFNGRTTGAPVTMMTWNADVDSSKYEKYRDIPRPGHADYPAILKYGGFHDYRGSGRFSGRLTAGIVMAGTLARQIVNARLDVKIYTHVREIGGISYDGPVKLDILREKIEENPVRCYDPATAKEMVKAVEIARDDNDSVGGIVECIIEGLPAGLGNPRFGGLASKIGAMMFSLGAVKGIEFGAGFKSARMRGSEHNDGYSIDGSGNIVLRSNNAGGILGGMASGNPVVFRVAVKPTSSIGKKQKSMNLKTRRNVELEYEGRHDPCIAPRIAPVVEAAAWVVIIDSLLDANFIPAIYEA